jgi:hypothetical protein
MASPAQVLANQANAQKSTGPVTLEGKAKSSKNNTSHGLAAAVFHIPEADREAFSQFEAKLKESVQPEGALEIETCSQLLHAAWRLRQIQALTRGLYEKYDADPLSVPEAAAELRQLNRYRATIEMMFYRSIKHIRTLQTMRAARDLQFHEPEKTYFPPQLKPVLYSKALYSKGDRELLLMAAGVIGARISVRYELDENFLPVAIPVEPKTRK